MKFKLSIVLLLIAMVLSACGGSKADVSIYMIPRDSQLPQGKADKLQQQLADKLGEKPTIDVAISPMYNDQKMIVEIVAGGHDIIAVSEEDFKAFAAQGGLVSLDEEFGQDKFPEMVVEATEGSGDQEKKVTHLYGVPLDQTSWFAESGLDGKGIVAFIPQNAPHIKDAKQVLKAIVE